MTDPTVEEVEGPALTALPTVLPTDGCAWDAVYADCGGECEAYEAYEDPAAAQALWEAVASDLLWHWTGQVFGVCEVAVRPCRTDCGQGEAWSTYWGRGPRWDPTFPAHGGPGVPFYPVLIAGSWHNVTCGCAGICVCGPTGPTVLTLPGPIQAVTSIYIDGALLPPTAYHVANKRHLVRDDGEVWPKCQDLTKPSGPQYEPVVVTNPTNRVTFTRSGQMVQALVEPIGAMGGNFAGPIPWPARASVTQESKNAAGTPVGTILINKGAATLSGGSAPFVPFHVLYETSAAPDPNDSVDTFEVTYTRGVPVPIGGQIAVGRLACELALGACGSEECALPDSLVSLTRQGIGMSFQDPTQPGANATVTGIRSIDWWVASVTAPAKFASIRSYDSR